MQLQGPMQHSGNKITVIFEWQDEVMRSRPEARSPNNGRGEKGVQNMVTASNDCGKQAVLRSMDKIATSGVLLSVNKVDVTCAGSYEAWQHSACRCLLCWQP